MESRNASRYTAFISYSHADKKEVFEFHKYLERYRLPGSVRRMSEEFPKTFAPVFIDKDNLAGTKLDERLRLALHQSDHLIVVCSPRSAVSSYVNEEVRYFISIGKADKIIPYILEGKPKAADPAQECYTPALRELNPLGADVKDLGEKKARLRVIASMLNLDLDLLVQKEKNRKIKRGITVAVGIVALGFAIGIPYDYYHNPKDTYYANYVDVKGIPQGIGEPIGREERKNRTASYRITRLAGKVIALSYVNAYGDAIEPSVSTVRDDAAIREYTYDDAGSLTNVAFENKDGQVLVNWKYANDGEEISLRDETDNTVDLENFDKLIEEDDLESISKTNGIKGYKLVYDEKSGYMMTKLYTAYAGSQSIISNDNGVYGQSYEYYDNGELRRVFYLGENGQPATNAYGAAYLEYQYDAQGRLLTQIYYDENGNRINGSGELAELRMTYDGNLEIQEAFDAAGHQAEISGMGAYKYVAESDEKGNLISNSYYDADGKPVISAYGYAKCTMQYDAAGHQISVSFLDEDDEPLSPDTYGYHTRIREYSTENEITTIVEEYNDCEDQPTVCGDGYAKVKESTDQFGNIVLQEYYDLNDAPTSGPEGYFRAESEVNGDGHVVKTSYFGSDGSPYLYEDCYAAKTMSYEDDLCTDVYFLDENDQPTSGPKGYAHIHYEYNEWERIKSNRFYNENEQLTNCIYGYAVSSYGYDENGNINDAQFFDENEEPTIDEDGVHEMKFVFENGKITETSYYGKENEPVLCKGVHKVEMDRDAAGNVLCLRNFGIHSEPVLCEDGFYSYEKEYDESGKLVSIRYYDTEGNVIPSLERE